MHYTRENKIRRKDFIWQISAPFVLPVLLPSVPANAAQSVSKEKLTRLHLGLDRLDYLLANWKKLTTSKNTNEYGDYDRTPVIVMEYMGFKSTDDPLFNAEKLLIQASDLVPNDRYKEYAEAIDIWGQKSEEANGMAFVSSWGEANPGGGKDRVEIFIERARLEVVQARDALKIAVDILGV